jgi:hypothetical protein
MLLGVTLRSPDLASAGAPTLPESETLLRPFVFGYNDRRGLKLKSRAGLLNATRAVSFPTPLPTKFFVHF